MPGNNLRRALLTKAYLLSDLGLMIVAAICASLVEYEQLRSVPLQDFFQARVRLQNVFVVQALLLAWHYVFRLCDLYESRRLSSRNDEAFDVLKATTIGTVLVFGTGKLLHVRIFTLLFLVVFWLVATGATIVSRIVMRRVLAFVRRRGRNLRHIAIVGTNERAMSWPGGSRANRNSAIG